MITTKLSRAGFLKSIVALCAVALTTLPVFSDEKPAGRWEKDIHAFEMQDATNPPPQSAVLFIGSSSIRMWKSLPQAFPEVKVINRGFGGSEISDSVHFADRIVIPYHPKMIVLHAGGNDINAGKSPERVLADFKDFVTTVRAALPETRIAFVSINPSPKRAVQLEKQRKANALIRDYVPTVPNCEFIDIVDALLDKDGNPREDLVIADKLHPNAEGYKIRADIIRPHLAWLAAGANAKP